MADKEWEHLPLTAFYKRHPGDQVWWVHDIGLKGPVLFSFDRKKVYNFWPDYPDHLTMEQKEIFDKENPFWAAFYRGDLKADPWDDEE